MNTDNNIRIRRMQLGLSMGALAVKAGLSRRKLEYIEQGNSKHINLESLSKIANALGCKALDLLAEADIAKLGSIVAVFFLTSNIG